MNKGNRANTHLKPGTPTWIGDADWDAVMRRTFLSCKLHRVPHISAAQAFVVRDVAAPPRMIDLAASLGGGLVASVAHIARPPGPIIRYGRALSQQRALWISSGARNMSPNTIDLIRKVVTHAATTTTGTRCTLICQADFFTDGRTRPARPPPSTRTRGTCHGHGEGGAASAREAPLSVAFRIRNQLQARHDLTLRANTQLEWGR